MDRRTYFKKLSRLVSWRLPRAEAEEVLCDYREMLSRRPEGEDGALLRELGTPLQAARLLTEPKPYHRWLAAFAVMAACLLIPEFLLLRAHFYDFPTIPVAALFALGMTVCLLWFRPRRRAGRGPLPKGLLPALLAFLVGLAAVGAAMASVASGVWTRLPLPWYGPVVQGGLWFLGTAAAIVGILGLVKARISDRRWRALYVLGLAVVAVCVLVTALLRSLDMPDPATAWWVPYAVPMGAIGAAGLAGAGAALC